MNQAKVLIVEDEAPVRQMIAFNLNRAGYSVDEAGDVASARSCIADNRPDLVLLLLVLRALRLVILLRAEISPH